MTGEPADGVTTTPKLYGGQPNEAGWFPILALRDGVAVLVAAGHIREGVSFEDAQAVWEKNGGPEVSHAFDAVLYGHDIALEKLKNTAGGGDGAPVATANTGKAPPQDQTAPGAKGNTHERAKFDPTRTAYQRATGRNSGEKNRQYAVPERPQNTHAEGGSRKGKKDGRFENAWWTAFAGFAKSYFDGISEIGVTLWDIGGAIVDALDKDYEHDYLSNVGRAVGEQGKNLGDVILEGTADRIKAAGRMIEDIQRGDYYAAGAEAQSLPGPGGSPLSVAKVAGKAAKAFSGVARRTARSAKARMKSKRSGSGNKSDVRRDPARMPRDLDGQPDFDQASFHDFRMKNDMIGPHVSDAKQFRQAVKDLKAEMVKNPKLWDNFSPKEQRALRKAFGNMSKPGVKSARIKGFRWHHHTADPTVLRLIKAEVHDFAENLHYGGRFVTGGR